LIKIQNNQSRQKNRPCFENLDFEHLILFRISSFVLRILLYLTVTLGFVFRRSPLSPLSPDEPEGPESGERKAEAKNNSPDSQEPSQATFSDFTKT